MRKDRPKTTLWMLKCNGFMQEELRKEPEEWPEFENSRRICLQSAKERECFK